jgi:hypothetical protein
LTLSIEMEEVRIASNSENERKGRDFNLGVEGSNSYGHVMKIIEILQKDSQAHRVVAKSS